MSPGGYWCSLLRRCPDRLAEFPAHKKKLKEDQIQNLTPVFVFQIDRLTRGLSHKRSFNFLSFFFYEKEVLATADQVSPIHQYFRLSLLFFFRISLIFYSSFHLRLLTWCWLSSEVRSLSKVRAEQRGVATCKYFSQKSEISFWEI